MNKNNQNHKRRSIRLKNYDYSEAGAYFVTICAHNRECLFGCIMDSEIVLNNAGRIVADEWRNTTTLRQNIELDEFVVMPNHIHGIVVIAESRRGVLPYAPTNDQTNPKPGVLPYAPTNRQKNHHADTTSTTLQKFKSPSQTIGAIIRGFKSSVTRQINILRNRPGIPIWQRNYYERVIRDENELNHIREYITNNPFRWDEDKENPGLTNCRGVLQYAPIKKYPI